MPKPKSSASSATRKKQANKAAKKAAYERDEDGNLLRPDLVEALEKAKQRGPQRGQKKDKSKKDGNAKKGKGEKKQYIPPPKPPQPLPDPLDSMGLASLLPAGLVVLLRKASKKDVITRCRALEALLAWVQDALAKSAKPSDDQDASGAESSNLTAEGKHHALVMMLPSWVHLFPRLALSPTRRLRLLTMQIHTLLLEKPQQPSDEASSTRAELLESPQYIEPMLGPWAILCHDTDRTIERLGRTAWSNTCTWQSAEHEQEATASPKSVQLDLNEHSDTLIAHLKTILLSPSPSYAFSMTASLAVGASDPSMSRTSSGHATPSLQTGNVERDAKNRDENVEEDTAALDKRLVAGALAVLTSIIQQRPAAQVVQSLESVLSSRLVWASLSPHNLAASSGKRHEAASSVTSFGYDSPAVRLRAWTLLRTLYSVVPDVVNQNLSVIGTVVMASIWQERDHAVQRATIDAVLPLLKNRPKLWLTGADQNTKGGAQNQKDGQDDSDDEDGDDEDSDEDDDDQDGSSDNDSDDDGRHVDPISSADASRPKPHAYTSFLQWLQSACGGAPNVGYTAVVVFISTIPAEILPHHDLETTSDLLTQFFSALYSRPLDFDPTGCRAFLASFAECVTFLALRTLRAGSTAGSDSAASATELVRVHLGAAWEELVLDKDSILGLLATDSTAKDNDDTARASRIKSIGSSRIVSDLAVQVRRLASANPDLKILQAFLADVEQGIVSVTHALSQAAADLSLSWRAQILASLERATSFYAALAPSQGRQASTELRSTAAATLAQVIRLTVTGLASVASDTNLPSDLRRVRATLLVDFLSLLVRAAVSLPDALDPSTSHELAQATSVSLPRLLGTKGVAPASTAAFLTAYLAVCKDAATRASIWTETLSSVAHLEDLSDRIDTMSELISASKAVLNSQDGDKEIDPLLPVPAPEAGVEELMMELVFALCDSGSLPNQQRRRLKNVVADVLANPAPFVSQDGRTNMLKVTTSTIEQLRSVLFERLRPDEDVQSRQAKAAVVVVALIGCINVWLEAQPDEQSRRLLSADTSYTGFVTALSDLRSLRYDSSRPSDEVVVYSDLFSGVNLLHSRIMSDALPERRAELDSDALDSLQDHLLDLQIPVSRLVSTAGAKIALLPDHKELAEMLVKACKHESNPALLVFDPLVSQSCATKEAGSAFEPLVDNQGLGIFARVCLAALLIMRQNRESAKSNLRLLPLVVMLSILIEDDLLLAGASKHALDSTISPADHREWLKSAVKMSTALISTLSERVTENWHNDMVASLQRGATIDADKDGIGHVLSALWQLAAQGEGASSYYLARIFHRLLNAAFSFGTITEAGAERWLKLGDAVQDRMPAMAYAIFNAAKPIAGSSPGYDRLRNGAAAKLSGLGPGIPQSKLLASLRAVVALAPAEDSELSLIPQQRAIFLLKDLEKWYASDESDEEADDEVNTRLAELLVHLLPVVQDVQGSHIEFMFDIIETNLEFCSLHEDASLAQLFHTLRLFELMRELASRNANLREYWTSHSKQGVENLRILFLSLAGVQSVSAAQQACIDLIVDLIRETSESPFSLHESAQALCTLVVRSPLHEVQVVAFRLLSSAIRENVKELVVEAAIDADALVRKEEGKSRLKIPEALIANVSDSLSAQLNLIVEEAAARRTAFGYFLSWIAVFEHFEGASMWVKAAFLEDLEKRGVLVESLLPSVFALVGLADETRRSFDPSRFEVEEVFLDHMDVESSLTVLQVLAAHVYLRALIHVATKVRAWWGEIKDRQHWMHISSFTTRHCSPVIANRELWHLRQPDALAKLQDDALSIKILSTNEIIATYLVDEHSMEIGIKIPSDFPLHGVEIRDIQRVGISEAKWRAWLLDVQQLITGQNGLIFDALSLFKRYAEVQFQGLDECAICYSIISPMDRSLPTKPCRTCKNKFHAGCLFKWISTSGASTCPLCRSIL